MEKTDSTAPSTKPSSKLLNRRNVGNGLARCVLGRETLEHSDQRALEVTLGRHEEHWPVTKFGPAAQKLLKKVDNIETMALFSVGARIGGSIASSRHFAELCRIHHRAALLLATSPLLPRASAKQYACRSYSVRAFSRQNRASRPLGSFRIKKVAKLFHLD